MHNPDFWEVCLEPVDLARYPNEAGIWYESREDSQAGRTREYRVKHLIQPIMELVDRRLTQKQREALLLYFLYHKTQEEVAQIMGISRRVGKPAPVRRLPQRQTGRRSDQKNSKVMSRAGFLSRCIRWRVFTGSFGPVLIDQFNRAGAYRKLRAE